MLSNAAFGRVPTRFSFLATKSPFLVGRLLVLGTMLLALGACGGGGGSNESPPGNPTPTTFTLSVTVSDLSGGTLVLQNNGGDDLTFTTNETQTFATALANAAAYDVKVLTQPTGQTCTVTGGTGTISGANVSLTVSCVAATYTVSATVTRLSGTLVLRNNGGDDLTFTANETKTFATAFADLAAYDVKVLTQPTDQTCTVSNGSGNIAGSNVTATVACQSGYPVQVTVSGYNSTDSLFLTLNGNTTNPLPISADGTYSFTTNLNTLATYDVTVALHPTGQSCFTANGSGTISGAAAAVTVTCNLNATDSHNVQVSITDPAGLNLTGLTFLFTQGSLGTERLTLIIDAALVISATKAPDGATYTIQVTPPADVTCTFASSGTATATGTVSGGNPVEALTCVPAAVPLKASVTRLTGTGLVLQNSENGDTLTVNASGTSSFPVSLAWGDTYTVGVTTQPAGQTCTVLSPTGTVYATSVTLSVTCNTTPVANAGTNQPSIAKGATVNLDGLGSTDADSDNLTYAWTQVGTTPAVVTLTGAGTATPSFTAPGTGGLYTFSLLVSDPSAAVSAADTVVITVVNQAPAANAGLDQPVKPTVLVTLDGSGSSDADSDGLTYAWSQVGTSPAVVTLITPTAVQTTFTAPTTPGPYTFDLVVNDGEDSSPADQVVITVANANPVANAGAAVTVNAGETVTLNGTASTDPDGDPLFYAWSQTPAATVALNADNLSEPAFAAPATAGDLTFDLTVSDAFTGTDTDSVTVTIQTWEGAPVTPPRPQQLANTTGTDSISDVGVDASYAYVATLSATWPLRVIDLLDGSETTFDSGNAGAAIAVGTARVYMADNLSTIQIVNTTTPATPSLMGTYSATGVKSMLLDGATLYVARGTSGLDIVDVTSDASPVPLGTETLSGINYGEMALADSNTLYVAAPGDGFHIVDVSNSNAPDVTTATGLLFASAVRSVAASGTTAYVGTASDGVQIVDASNTATPSPVGIIGVPSGSGVQDLRVVGTRLYVLLYPSGGTRVYNITSPQSPTLIGEFFDAFGFDLAVSATGDKVAVGAGFTFYALDAATPTPAPDFGGLLDPGSVWGVTIAGKYAYAGDTSKFHVIDISNVAAPTLMGTYTSAISGLITDIAVRGRYAYVAAFTTLEVIDISDPAAPTPVTSFPGGTSVALGANALYVGTSNGLKVYDISVTPEAPDYKGILPGSSGYTDHVAAQGTQVAFAQQNSNTLLFYNVDLGNLPASTQTGSFTMAGTQLKDLIIRDDFAYLVSTFISTPKVEILDTITATPNQMAVITLPSNNVSWGLALAGNHLMIGSGATGAYVYDVTNKSAPVLVGRQGLGVGAQVAVSGDTLALADANNGLFVTEWRPLLSMRYDSVDLVATLPPLSYGVSWVDSNPAQTAEVKCAVTTGDCAVVIDTANTATVNWTPTQDGDHEIQISVGTYNHYGTARDRVTVTGSGGL